MGHFNIDNWIKHKRNISARAVKAYLILAQPEFRGSTDLRRTRRVLIKRLAVGPWPIKVKSSETGYGRLIIPIGRTGPQGRGQIF